MTDRLRFDLRDNGFEIAAPKTLVDKATSQWGPMLDEYRQPSNKAIVRREYGPDGVALSFNLPAILGQAGINSVYKELRSQRIWNLIRQMNNVALEDGLADPRVLPFTRNFGFAQEYGVSFERPIGDESTITQTARDAMKRYGLMTGFYDTSLNAERVRTSFNNDKVVFETGTSPGSHEQSRLVTYANVDYRPAVRAIELTEGAHSFSARAHLVSFLGVLAILPPESYFVNNRQYEIENTIGERRVSEEPELRDLAENISVAVADYGDSTIDGSRQTLYWHSFDGRHRVVFENIEGIKDGDGTSQPAGLLAHIIETSERGEELNRIQFGFRFHDRSISGSIDSDDDISVAFARRGSDTGNSWRYHAVDHSLTSHMSKILSAVVLDVEADSRQDVPSLQESFTQPVIHRGTPTSVVQEGVSTLYKSLPV